MTLAEIQERVQAIRLNQHDDEMAHWLEDDLRRDFIRYIASGMTANDSQLEEKAQLILTTEELNFCRWCA